MFDRVLSFLSRSILRVSSRLFTRATRALPDCSCATAADALRPASTVGVAMVLLGSNSLVLLRNSRGTTDLPHLAATDLLDLILLDLDSLDLFAAAGLVMFADLDRRF